MTVDFIANGQKFIALNGGPLFQFNESISFVVNCKTQKEIDYYWKKLTAQGGREVQCGWLRDKFGISWQIVPAGFQKMMDGKNKEGSRRAFSAMFKMKKFEIAKLEKAFRG
jgi:predicted 3-demethylubiquinone-9 3-methyltransferase (glyoxalase superfamily)